MRNICLVIMFLMVSVLPSYSQQKHVVRRGESLEQLAQAYNTTVEEIKAANPNVKGYYVGMSIVIPVADKVLYRLGNERDLSLYNRAMVYMEHGENKKAERLLTSIVERLPSSLAYQQRGICFYHRGKYGKAILDFSSAMECEDCDDKTREECTQWQSGAEQLRTEREERACLVFDGLMEVGTQVAFAILENQAAKENMNANNGGMLTPSKDVKDMSTDEYKAYINRCGYQMAKQAAVNVMRQQEQEKIQVQNQFIIQYRRIHGKDPSDEEVQAAYNNYINAKVAAYQSVKQAEVETHEDVSRDTQNRSNVYTGFHCKKMHATDIAHCNDSGVCQNCNGNGVTTDMFGKTKKCVTCGGDGVCPTCRGRYAKK